MPDYYIKNADDTYTLVSEKLAKEQDVINVKLAAETKQTELANKVTELQASLDGMTTRATTAETALTGKESEIATLKESADKLPEVQQLVTDLQTRVTAAETQALTTRREAMKTKYGLNDDNAKKLESMSSDQLNSFEETAALLGTGSQNNQQQQQKSSFDRTTNSGSGSGKPASSTELIKAGMSELVPSGGRSSE